LPDPLRKFHASLPAPNEIHVNYRPSSSAVGEILEAVRAAGLVVADVRTEEVDLEDIFLQLTRARPPTAA
jgi:ABC-2 type transport system ATP-binding protein